MRTPITLIFASLTLSACATDRVAENAAHCRSFGFQPETPIFLECVESLTELDAKVAAIKANKPNALAVVGAALTGAANGARTTSTHNDYPEPMTFRSGAAPGALCKPSGNRIICTAY